MLTEFWHDFVREQLHGLALPRFIWSIPIEPGHQQSAKRSDFFAKGDKLIEDGCRRSIQHAIFGHGFDSHLIFGHVGTYFQHRQ